MEMESFATLLLFGFISINIVQCQYHYNKPKEVFETPPVFKMNELNYPSTTIQANGKTFAMEISPSKNIYEGLYGSGIQPIPTAQATNPTHNINQGTVTYNPQVQIDNIDRTAQVNHPQSNHFSQNINPLTQSPILLATSQSYTQPIQSQYSPPPVQRQSIVANYGSSQFQQQNHHQFLQNSPQQQVFQLQPKQHSSISQNYNGNQSPHQPTNPNFYNHYPTSNAHPQNSPQLLQQQTQAQTSLSHSIGNPQAEPPVSQSLTGQLNYYQYKQSVPGDTRAFQRIITTCNKSGQCSKLSLAPGQIDPILNQISYSSRASLSASPSKCKQLAEAKSSYGRQVTYDNTDPNYAGGSYIPGPTVSLPKGTETKNGQLRPANRRKYAYSEVVQAYDPYN